MRPGENYAVDEDRGKPGSCIIRGKVAAIMGQWKPGKCGASYAKYYPNYEKDETDEQREQWFAEGLQSLRNLKSTK